MAACPNNHQNSRQRGVTIVELLVVVAILAIIILFITLSVEADFLSGIQSLVGGILTPIAALFGLDVTNPVVQEGLRIELLGGIMTALILWPFYILFRGGRD